MSLHPPPAGKAYRSAASLPAEKRESVKPLPNYCLEVNDAVIVVQSCDDETANIGVQWHGKITYCRVALPSLEREWQKWYYSDVRQEIYDMVLRENKSRLLEHIRKLNAAEQNVHLTAFGAGGLDVNPLQMPLFADVSPATIGGR